VDLISLSINQGSGTGEGGEPVYNFSIALRTYWLK
jgi:hypothetical protein